MTHRKIKDKRNLQRLKCRCSRVQETMKISNVFQQTEKHLAAA